MIEAAVARALVRRGRGRFARVSSPFPRLDLQAVFGAHAEAFYVSAPGGPTRVALGAAARLVGSGPDRFTQLRDAARTLPRDARLYTAGTFSDDEARAVLPRLELVQDDASCTVVVTIDRDAPPPDVRDELAALSMLPRADEPRAPRLLRTSSDDAAFLDGVARARADMAAGALEKVVLHRQTEMTLDRPLSLAAVLRRLARDQPTTTRYAMRDGDAAFVVATPERLVCRRGAHVEADVLAGSLPHTPGTDARSLLASTKDRAEHALTRTAIGEALASRCDRIALWGPMVRSLPHVHHLHTRIEGHLARPTHVLDLVAALHPTPAVGGVPRAAALAFIAAHERRTRGWYAGPIGWFEPGGDGDFSVALRCALVEGTRITSYAGAGIVTGSEPARELAEVVAKARAMSAALGLAEEPAR